MNVKTAAQTIRDTVRMDDILSLYGYHANRSGFMCCPFHGEREPSLKIYEKNGGWHCFGCGRGGSVVDFVMEHEECNFRTAVIAIDKALHLGLMDPGESPFDESRQRNVQQALDGFVAAVYAVCDAMIFGIENEKTVNWKRMKKCIDEPQTATTEDWNFYFNWEEEDNYNDYRIEKINELKKEVAAWRRANRKGL